MLENLCLETVSDHPVMPCVDRFMACLRSSLRHEGRKPSKSQEPVFPKNEVKAKAQAFLAGMREACASVGIAACKGYWNFDHSTLTDLRTFLSKLGPVTRSTAER
jgi:hypothetical protein